MLDTSLKARQVRLESIGESGLVVRDVNGRRVQVNPGEVIALLPERAQSGVRAAGIRWVESTGDAGVAPLGRLATTDGQSLPGRLGSEEPAAMNWSGTPPSGARCASRSTTSARSNCARPRRALRPRRPGPRTSSILSTATG